MPKREKGVGEWIRDHLENNGTAYVREMHRAYSDWCEERDYTACDYDGFRRQIYLLRRLGLIELDHTEPGTRGPFRRRYYRIAPGADAADWQNPQKQVYGDYPA